MARYDGCTIDRNGSGAVDEYEQSVFAELHDLLTGKAKSITTKVMKRPMPIDEITAPGFTRRSYIQPNTTEYTPHHTRPVGSRVTNL